MKYILIFYISISNLFSYDCGELLFDGNCVTCHFKTKSISAPSMNEVQQRYKKAFPNKKEFVEYMATWVQHPNKNSSLMQDAITKYEIMPELGFDKNTLEKISCYIYETDFTLHKVN